MEDCKDTLAGGCLCGAVRNQASGSLSGSAIATAKAVAGTRADRSLPSPASARAKSFSPRASDGSKTPHPAWAEPSAAGAERPSPGKAKANFPKGVTSSNFTSAPWTSPRLSSRRTTYFTQRNCLGSTWPTICPGILAWTSTVKYADTDQPTAVCRNEYHFSSGSSRLFTGAAA